MPRDSRWPLVEPAPGPRGEASRCRTLIYIPVVHTQADMGALARSVRSMTVQKLGRRALTRNIDVVGQLWATINAKVRGFKLPWTQVRLYQDGLPVCGREADIVRDLAQAGSPNHQLLLWLMSQGATLMGTEAPELLLAEYRLVQLALEAEGAAKTRKRAAQNEEQSRSLLARRDEYIAGRINESLHGGETGLLFLGMLHSVEPRLAGDIRVIYPICRPAQRQRRTS